MQRMENCDVRMKQHSLCVVGSIFCAGLFTSTFQYICLFPCVEDTRVKVKVKKEGLSLVFSSSCM